MNLIPEPEAQFRREVSTTHEAGAAGVTPPCSPSHVMSMTASPPYPLTTPLANTRGIVPLLKPLCGQGNDWRDLAEAVGLIYGDQMDIKERSKDNDIHHLLVDCLINQNGDNATIHVLLDALQKTGTRGRGVVNQMVNSGLIRPLDENRNAAGAEGGGLLVSSVEDRTPNTRAPKTPTTKSGLAKNTGLAGNDNNTQVCPININMYFNVNQPKNVQFGDQNKAVFPSLNSYEEEDERERGRCEHQDDLVLPAPDGDGAGGEIEDDPVDPFELASSLQVLIQNLQQIAEKPRTEKEPATEMARSIDGEEPPPNEMPKSINGEEPPPNEMPRSIDGKEPPPNGMGRNFNNKEPPPNGMKKPTNNKEPPPKTPNEIKGSVIIKATVAMIEAFLGLE